MVKLDIIFIHSKVLHYFSVCFLKFDTLMIKKLSLLPLLLAVISLRAQTIKTDVLVIGGGPDAVAAAIQSARSKVKTVLAAEKIEIAADEQKLSIGENARTPSGIWAEFRNHVTEFYKATAGNDTAFAGQLRLDKNDGGNILTKMADSIKKLTIELNTTLASIEKNGDEWEVRILKDGKPQEIKARVVIDATGTGIAAEKAGAKVGDKIRLRQTVHDPELLRTSIAAGEPWPPMRPEENTLYTFWYIPLKSLVASGVENLFVTNVILPSGKDANLLPVQLAAGQAAGAAAAYCAFFKKSSAHLNVRAIQGELLDFKTDLRLYYDIPATDMDWRQIQQISATGLLGDWVFFNPDKPVLTADIETVLKAIYTRAFLWFNRERPGEKFTVGNMLSFISDYTLTDPAILKTAVQKAWQMQFKFKSEFDLNRPVSRREFAVLANKYLNPFARTVDLNGRFVN